MRMVFPKPWSNYLYCPRGNEEGFTFTSCKAFLTEFFAHICNNYAFNVIILFSTFLRRGALL
jgi:hypothetical protein